MHVSFCESFGVSKIDLENATESPANLAYSRYIMDVGSQGDSLDLLVAVLSCLIGYGEVGLYLARKAQEGGQIKLEGNPYRKWMDDYNGKEFQDAVHAGIGESFSESSLSSLVEQFIRERFTDICIYM